MFFKLALRIRIKCTLFLSKVNLVLLEDAHIYLGLILIRTEICCGNAEIYSAQFYTQSHYSVKPNFNTINNPYQKKVSQSLYRKPACFLTGIKRRRKLSCTYHYFSALPPKQIYMAFVFVGVVGVVMINQDVKFVETDFLLIGG